MIESFFRKKICFAESSISSSSQLDGEAGVLVQAIMSIKAIIKHDPTSYDKVIVLLFRP